WFVFRRHLVFVNELLSINLYDLLKQNQYQGLSTNLVRVLVQQILDAMIVLNNAQIIHADLKPENILLESMEKPVVKVIDFGSACFEWQTTFTYIQSRFYRSPEILLGLPYSSRIDMWSLGCIVAELYLGLPLFPGSSEYNQLSRIIELLGTPPANMLEKARRTDEFFNYLGPHIWDYKSMAQYSRERNTDEKESKRYFAATTLDELITTYPVRRRLTDTEQQREYQSRIALIDFLRGLLQLDPAKRWSPQQASMHPFITGDPLIRPFVPPHISSGHQSGGSGGGGGYNSNAHGAFKGHSHQGGSYQIQGNSAGSNNAMGTHTYSTGYGTGYQQSSAIAYANGVVSNGQDPTYKYAVYPAASGRSLMDESTTIPGSFPINADSGQPSSLDHQQSMVQTAQHSLYNRDTKGRVRATTISYPSGGIATQTQNMILDPENQPLFEHGYAQPNTRLQGVDSRFLGVDPSTSFIDSSPVADGGLQDMPGRPDIISRSGSNYSGESAYGWAVSRLDNNYDIQNSYPQAVLSSSGSRTGSLYGSKQISGGHVASSHYLPNEKQQQQSHIQQRQLYYTDTTEPHSAVLHSYSGDGLVPLPEPSNGCGRMFVISKNTSSDTAVHGIYADRTSAGQSAINSSLSPGEGSNSLSIRTTPSARNDYLFSSGVDTSNSALPISVSDRYSSDGHLENGKYAIRARQPISLLRNNSGFRMVSNFSPLTLPSTPGSLSLNRQGAEGEGDDDVKSVHNGSDSRHCNGAMNGNRIDRRSVNGAISDASAGSFADEQGSETSYSLYSAASGGEDGYLTHGHGVGDVDSWVDGESDMDSTSDKSDGHNDVKFVQPLVFIESSDSAYQNPRFSPQGSDAPNHADSSFSDRRSDANSVDNGSSINGLLHEALPGPGDDEDWESDDYDIRDDVDDRSVISQEDRAVHEGTLPHSELDISPSFVDLAGRQRISKDMENIFEGLKDRDSSSDKDSRYSADFSSDDERESGTEDADPAHQDTVVYIGKLRPSHVQIAGGIATSSLLSKLASAKRGSSASLAGMVNDTAQSLENLHVSFSPTSANSAHNVTTATHPQKIVKKTQMHPRRTSRATQIKDHNMRMIESLRRMGKLKDSGSSKLEAGSLFDGSNPAFC
ncbi:dual specificity protein kinase yak1, partial [Coemansia sp. RSA 1285]